MLLLTSTSDLVRLTTSKPNNAQIVIQKQPDGSYVGQRFEQTTGGEINGSTTINSRA